MPSLFLARRLLPAAAAFALLAAQAAAQTTPSTTPGTTPAPATEAPAPATGTPMMHKPATHRVSLQQRFDTANTTHDGHLTKDQAAAANWSYVSGNFSGIDKDKKGYVTVADIRAFAKARRAEKKKMTTPATAPAQPSKD